MPWSNQSGGGGGPWGGGNNGGPWGGGGGNNNGPWGGGPNRGGGGGGGNPPDLEELLKRTQDRMKNVLPGGGGGLGILGVLIVIGLGVLGWLATGVYIVDEGRGEVGVELVLGKVTDQTGTGFHYNWPYPIGEVYKPQVEQQRETTVGVEELFTNTGAVRSRDVPEESLMLTGDENIVDVGFKVQWRIKNTRDGITNYLFNIQNPEGTVKAVAESAMREVVGESNIDAILTQNRVTIQNDVATLMQSTLDSYLAGIEITEVQMQKVDPPQQVIDSFRDVQAARADQERIQNEAQAYANRKIPEARGEAARVLEAANAYKEQTIAEATGQSQRFTKIYQEYKLAPDVTRERLYLETLEKVLGENNKIIIDSQSSGSGVLPFLPLNDLNGRGGGQSTRTGGN
ncbi:FtsH protease activity modulator HflK [Roseibium alexandrii]|jgi:membrane protease subunit HflK|uniref:Protein HflK n=2 Tax=Roseibium alexandrii TaxID=388408 RepID=A0A0M7A0D2_9HYPH|nr:FtsH protease activity modulator HflK [Roseibium alexandrii]EEE45955.2 HflK protein [Roseibium alexandrii DFL-11]CTQ68057.1 Modulator of FtsH protease HflK [Roseibium alexandrii]